MSRDWPRQAHNPLNGRTTCDMRRPDCRGYATGGRVWHVTRIPVFAEETRMDLRLRPIHEQVAVITGASSGIGLVTAKKAAAAGARVVLAARNEADLRTAVAEIRANGGRAIYQVADVADRDQVERIAASAMAEFGRIDTWINNAAVSIYGRSVDIPIEDLRRQFDVIYWGNVYGMLTAVAHMRRRGGAIVNVASALADRA